MVATMDHSQHNPQRLSNLYQYHNAPEVAPAHGLEYDDTNYSTASDKYPVIPGKHYDPTQHGKHMYDDRPPRIIFGMKIRTFLLVAAAMLLVIIGAAVGGAVGGKSMRENHAEPTSSTGGDGETGSTTLSATPSSFSAPVPTYTPLDSCPDANNTRYTSSFANGDRGSVPDGAGLNFTQYCDLGNPLTSVSEASTFSEAFVYSFNDCVEVCASLNFWSESRKCSVAVYEAKGSRPGNCWVGEADGVGVGDLEEKEGTSVAMLEV